MTVRTNDGLMPTSRAPVSSWITERTARPKVVAPKNRSSTIPTASAIAEAQTLPTAIGTPRIEIGSPLMLLMYNAPRIAPDEQSPDDERDPERQQETHERPLLLALAVDRPHQREVEQDGDAGCRQHAHERGQNCRNAVLYDERRHDRREHHDLAVREVEDTAETVDQGHPDAEQADDSPSTMPSRTTAFILLRRSRVIEQIQDRGHPWRGPA